VFYEGISVEFERKRNTTSVLFVSVLFVSVLFVSELFVSVFFVQCFCICVFRISAFRISAFRISAFVSVLFVSVLFVSVLSYQCFSYQCFRISAFRIMFFVSDSTFTIYIAEVGYLLIKIRQESVFPMKLIVFLECHFATVNIADTCLLSTRILDTYSQ